MAKISDQVGKAFEEAITNKLTVLQQLRIVAWWEHQQPAMFKRNGMWFKGSPSGADYSGVLRGGVAFALEVKSVGPKDGRDPVLVLEEAISEKQRAHLDAASQAGAFAALAVQFRRDRAPWVVAVIRWREIPWEIPNVRHHLRAEKAELHRIPTGVHLFEHLIGC